MIYTLFTIVYTIFTIIKYKKTFEKEDKDK